MQKKSENLNSRILSRPAELAFSQGLPMMGFFMSGGIIGWELWLFLVLSACAAWHILLFNDRCFHEATKKGKKIKREMIALFFLIPLIGGVLAGFYYSTVCFLLAALNWDFYSCKGKHNYILVSVHNFIGGFLHFAGGYFIFNPVINIEVVSIGLFFGLMMVGAGMHHDALDRQEDKQAGYKTGAVLFGERYWWTLGAKFIIAAQILLFGGSFIFGISMLFAFMVYIVFYWNVKGHYNHEKGMAFRALCRLAYGGVGVYYLLFKIF